MIRVRFALHASVLLLSSVATSVLSQTPPAPSPSQPPIDEIVARMQKHDADQDKELKHYVAMRHYKVEYAGLGTRLAGAMDVEITFDESKGKSFRIVSQSGSKLLCDKVLKRAVDSELEASQDRNSTALSPQNYQFKLTGTAIVDGRPTYILQVDPWHDSKFLYRGKVWIDAQDYAVVKVEAEPAKNPSFWISSTLIKYSCIKTGGAWLPAKNRSESHIRVGGSAVLSIDYGTYHVDLNSPPVATRGAF